MDKTSKDKFHVYIPNFEYACMFQDCVAGLLQQAIKINEKFNFGPSLCFDIDRLKYPKNNANNQNAAIIELVEHAKLVGKKDFFYCTKTNGKDPYLYVPSQQRTCLTSGDDACYKAGN